MAPRRPGSVAAQVGVVGAIAFVGFVLPLVIAHRGGALGIPRDDDWSYFRALFHWHDTGHLDFNHWVSMTLLGQLVIARPVIGVFGNDITAVQVLTATLGLVGLLAAAWIGFMVTGRLGVAGLVAIMIAVSPPWGVLSVSFMTDVPAFALTMLACAFGVRALRAQRAALPWFIAALLAAFVGFTIRQYAVVPFVAIGCVGVWSLRRDASRRRLGVFLGVVVVLTLSAGVVLAFWRTIPNLKPFDPALPTGHTLRATVIKGFGLVRLVGLIVAPALLLLGPGRILRRAWKLKTPVTIVAFLAGTGALIATAITAPRIAFAGNLVTPNGALGGEVLHGPRPDIFPAGEWWLVVVGATLASALLLAAFVPALVKLEQLVRRSARAATAPDPVVVLLVLVVAGYAATYAIASGLGLPIADRYVLPIVPLLGVLLVRGIDGRRPDDAATVRGARVGGRAAFVSAACALAIIACIGLVFSVDSASFDGTRWRVATAATRRGWSPEQVDGGFEWNKFHAPRTPRRSRPYCVTVRLQPRPDVDPHPIAFRWYRSPLVDPVAIVAVRDRVACSPAHAP